MGQSDERKASYRAERGFTFIEMVVVLVILSIVTSIAVPSFASLIKQNEMSTQINQMISALNMIRAESVRRGEPVSLCSSQDTKSCSQASWDKSWIAFVDLNANGTIDGSETPLQIFHSQLNSISVSLSGNTAVTYLPSGNTATAQTFTFCESDEIVEPKGIGINSIGRIKSTTKYDDDTPLKCA